MILLARRTTIFLGILLFACLANLQAQTCNTVTNTTTCTAANGTIGVGGASAESTPYPLTLTMPSLSGAIQNIRVQLNALKTTSTFSGGDFMIVLVSPHGEKLEILSQYCGDDADLNAAGVTLTFDDSGAFGRINPTNSAGFSCGSVTTGTFHTTAAQVFTSAIDTVPLVSLNAASVANPQGTGTLLTNFTQNPTGTWSLYVAMQTTNFDTGSLGGAATPAWSLAITMNAASTSTTTTVSRTAGSSPSTVGGSLTFHAVVSPTPTGGTMAFLQNGVTIGGCSAVSLSAGAADCVTTGLPEGAENITATYSGTTGFAGGASNNSVFQVVNNATTNPVALTYCNPGSISIPGTGATHGLKGDPASVYGSKITVSGLSGTVNTVGLTFKTFAPANPQGLGLMLVGPNSNTLDLFSYAGGTTGISLATLNIADNGASGHLTETGTPVSGNTYQPTSIVTGNLPVYCQASDVVSNVCGGVVVSEGAPNSFVSAFPRGIATLASQYAGISPNGTWTLYADNRTVTGGSIGGGWCLNFTLASGDPTNTVVGSSLNPSFSTSPNNSVTFTATVIDPNAPATLIGAGTMQFTDNGTVLTGCSAVAVATLGGGGGTAPCTSATLTEGIHNIQAFYSGTGSLGASNGSVSQTVNSHGTLSIAGSIFTYCNPGAIKVPGTQPGSMIAGPAGPYPSNIDTTGIPGTLNKLTVSMGNFMFNRPDQIQSLLVGPAATTGQSYNFFTQLNSVTAIGDAINHTGGINFKLDDAGTAITTVPSNAGTFKPYSSVNSSSFIPPAPAGTYPVAAPSGAITFANLYNAIGNAAGTWSLYMANTVNGGFGSLDDTSQTVNNAVPSWCVNITINPPVLSIAKSHTGNFQQGQQGAQFSIVVHNAGPGPAGGAVAVTVSDTLVAGFTPAATPGTGTGWACGALGQVVTCTNSTVVPSGSDFPTLTLNVNVAGNAGTPLTNQASVSGGGATGSVNSNTDSVTVVPSPVLTLSKNHGANVFTQGGSSTWNIVVGNSAAGSTTIGTITVTDTLPAGYVMTGYTGTGWNCAGISTINCTSTTGIAGGSSSTIAITVSIPGSSSVSVTNNASAFGGGDVVHTNSGNAVTASDTVTVVQVPFSITATGGTPQSTLVNTAFATNLQATVKDANSVAINNTPVVFTAPGAGASGTFSNTTSTISIATNASGIASASFTANGTAGANYTVTATAGAGTVGPANFSLTNTAAAPLVTNLTSAVANGTYGLGASIPIAITFDKVVNVTGTPLLALNDGGTASYQSGSGTATLTFGYTVGAGQNTPDLDAASTGALTLNGGTIKSAALVDAVLTVPVSPAAGALGTNKNIAIDTVAPTVTAFRVLWGTQSYSVIGSPRTRLPWQIAGIQVVFSKTIATGNTSSLSGATATGFSGLGTNTLTWTIAAIPLGNVSAVLAGAGPNVLADAFGNPLTGGAGYTQALKILWGDVNDDGSVNASDLTLTNAARSQPYNQIFDLNGDGVVDAADVNIARGRNGTSLP